MPPSTGSSYVIPPNDTLFIFPDRPTPPMGQIAYFMYLETIIDQAPHLQIIYHYEDDVGATLLKTTWAELDKFCTRSHSYEIKLEYYSPEKSDITQTYLPTDLKSWIDHLDPTYKQQLIAQFVAYCEHCQPSTTITFYP